MKGFLIYQCKEIEEGKKKKKERKKERNRGRQ